MKKVLLIIAIVFVIILASALFYKTDKEEIIETENNIVEPNIENTASTENTVGIENGNVSERIKSKVQFSDNECIAIGYVTDLNEAKFADKYFPDGEYGQIVYYDFRETVNKNDNYGNKFVIVPINGDVEITVYECGIDEEGELHIGKTLIQSISESFIMLNDYIEYIPKICVGFKYNGFEDVFPITFSGEDGSVDLTGHEMEVKDISLY